MTYQIQLKSQKALDKVAVFFQCNIYLEKNLNHWKKSCQETGVPIEENRFLFSLNYADDQVIRAKDADDLESALKN